MDVHLQQLLQSLKNADQNVLKEVVAFSTMHLTNVKRRSGESYAQHCMEVATVLREASAEISPLKVALLHDLCVHPDSKDLLKDAPLSDAEKLLVEQMNALRRLHIDENTDDLDTVIDAFMEQPELLPLRMAHRLNDVRHLQRFKKSLQKQIASETLHMYSAIAGRLGMQRWRVEMEDHSFPVIQKDIAQKLRNRFAEYTILDTACLDHTKEYLKKELRKHRVNATVMTRLKSLYSTYRKMVIRGRNFEDLTDRLAIRVLVDTPEDCYRALGIVHAAMHPIPGKLKDYIGAPKENGYCSIHTVVYPLPGVTEQPIEVQIRTSEMHHMCEYGPASHGEYKRSKYALCSRNARVNLFRNLQSIRVEARNPKQFEEALRNYFREDHIAIFDAENNLFHMKKPATAMDFVWHAHLKRAYKTKEIRINGRKRAIDTPLHDGDTVEVKFGREVILKEAWIHACKHKASQKLIRNCVKKSRSAVDCQQK